MRIESAFRVAFVGSILVAGCGNPSAPNSPYLSGGLVPSANLSPNRNLEVILRGQGFGHVKFRQPKDDEAVVYLDTWVRGLAPNTAYLLQRAVDTNIDDECTSEAWLTLGKGTVPQAIVTDERGTGREALFRNLPSAPGSAFDIHFRVIDATTGDAVLESACYQFVVSL